MNETEAVAAVKAVMGHPHGKCYVASEAVYHMLGGKASGYTPMVGHLYDPEPFTHWWLRRPDGSVLDVTAEQFGSESFPYHEGRGSGFLTGGPSKRARELMDAALSMA